jgi:hypothetical protein
MIASKRERERRDWKRKQNKKFPCLVYAPVLGRVGGGGGVGELLGLEQKRKKKKKKKKKQSGWLCYIQVVVARKK